MYMLCYVFYEIGITRIVQGNAKIKKLLYKNKTVYIHDGQLKLVFIFN